MGKYDAAYHLTQNLPGVVLPDKEFANRIKSEWWTIHHIVETAAERHGLNVERSWLFEAGGQNYIHPTAAKGTPLGILARAFGVQGCDVPIQEWLDAALGHEWCDGFDRCLSSCDQCKPDGRSDDFYKGWSVAVHLFSAWE